MRSRHTNRSSLTNTARDDDVAISTEKGIIPRPSVERVKCPVDTLVLAPRKFILIMQD